MCEGRPAGGLLEKLFAHNDSCPSQTSPEESYNSIWKKPWDGYAPMLFVAKRRWERSNG